MSHPLSFSRLERAETCPGSLVLPQGDRANPARRLGTVAHAFLRRVPVVGRHAALQEAPEDHREALETIDLARLPLSQDAYSAEVAYAYDVEADTARELGRDLERDYPETAPTEVVGTCDLVGWDGERVVILDWKTGRVAPAAKGNLQLQAYALCAARVLGARKATVGIIHVPLYDRDLEPRFDLAELDHIDLDATGARIGEIWESVRAARLAYEAGEDPKLVESDECDWCPAFKSCREKQSIFLKMLHPDRCSILLRYRDQLEQFRDALNLATAPTVALALERYDEVAAKARKILDEFTVANGPFPLGDTGDWYGPHPYARAQIRAQAAIEALRQRYGEDVATFAASKLEVKITKKAVEDSLRVYCQRTEGAKISREIKTAMAFLEETGAAYTKKSLPIGRYTPREERPASAP